MENKIWKIREESDDYTNIGFEVSFCNDKLIVRTTNNKYSVLNLVSEKRECEENSVYDIDIDISSFNIKEKILINYYDKEKKLTYRRYINKKDKITTYPGIFYFDITVLLYARSVGKTVLGNIKLEREGKNKENKVTLASVFGCCTSKKKLGSTKEIMNIYESEIDRICKKEHPDLIVLTEHFHNLSKTPVPKSEKYIDYDSSVLEIIKKKAIQYNTYIGGSYHIKDEDGKHNRAILIDREGNIIAEYDKMHLTISEYESALVPGNEIVTVDTDIGKIGFMICWDAWFPEYARLLQLENCDIIINPTRGEGIPQVNAVSYISGAYVVCAGETKRITRIQDKNGNSIDDATDDKGYAVATVDINKPEWIANLSVGNAYGEGRNIYKYERRPDLYNKLINE